MTEPRSEPDIYTLAWWRQQFRGVMHTLNRLSADSKEACEQVQTIRKDVARSEQESSKEREEMRAKLGEMDERLTALEQLAAKAKERRENRK